MINFVILCGGSGTRLWPKSRTGFAKQFIETPNSISLIQLTLNRIKKFISENSSPLFLILRK